MMDESRPLARNREHLWIRAQMTQAVRQFFIDRGYLEVETPIRIPAPAPEYHIDAVPSGDWFLHTSPELCMKRLLAADYPKFFRSANAFARMNGEMPTSLSSPSWNGIGPGSIIGTSWKNART